MIEALVAHFGRELEALVRSAKAAHQAATHEESRAEDRHDTFAIEASYLAAGQAARVADLTAARDELQALRDSAARHERIQLGSLVGLECEGRKSAALITRHGGGTQVQAGGMAVTLVSLSSPLGEHLEGLKAGDEFTVESKAGDRDYCVLTVD